MLCAFEGASAGDFYAVIARDGGDVLGAIYTFCETLFSRWSVDPLRHGLNEGSDLESFFDGLYHKVHE